MCNIKIIISEILKNNSLTSLSDRLLFENLIKELPAGDFKALFQKLSSARANIGFVDMPDYKKFKNLLMEFFDDGFKSKDPGSHNFQALNEKLEYFKKVVLGDHMRKHINEMPNIYFRIGELTRKHSDEYFMLNTHFMNIVPKEERGESEVEEKAYFI